MSEPRKELEEAIEKLIKSCYQTHDFREKFRVEMSPIFRRHIVNFIQCKGEPSASVVLNSAFESICGIPIVVSEILPPDTAALVQFGRPDRGVQWFRIPGMAI